MKPYRKSEYNKYCFYNNWEKFLLAPPRAISSVSSERMRPMCMHSHHRDPVTSSCWHFVTRNSKATVSGVRVHHIHRISHLNPARTPISGHKIVQPRDHQPISSPPRINPSWPQLALPLQIHLTSHRLHLQPHLGLPSTPPFSFNVGLPSRISLLNSVVLLASMASSAVS